MNQTGSLNKVGREDAAILIITDAPGKHAYDTGQVMSGPQMNLIKKLATDNSIPGSAFRMLTPCPPIPEEIETSERKVGEFLAKYRAEFMAEVHECDCVKLIVTLGKTALRQLAGRPVQILKARGSMTSMDGVFEGNVPILPLLSPAHALRRPEVLPVFEGDFKQVATLRESGWDEAVFEKSIDGADYKWVTDLGFLLKNRPKVSVWDIETVGLEWRNGRRAILCLSITVGPGQAYVIPLDKDYWNNLLLRGHSSRDLPKLTDASLAKLIEQVKELAADETIKKAGHNFKFDCHHLLNYGIEIKNWYIDTMQLAFVADDNMQLKNQNECVRRWVPEMAGYADAFDSDPIHLGKTRMDLVPHDKMIRYVGGDTDSCFRLATVLKKEAMKDSRNWNCFLRVQMPALRAFIGMERAGITMDKDALKKLGVVCAKREKELYSELLVLAAKKAPAILRKHVDDKEGIKFTPDLLIELLFTKGGFNLTPKVWTDTTKRLPPEQRIPSVSANKHLPFFAHISFVEKLIEYKKLQKMRSSYVGDPGGMSYKPIARLKNGKPPKAVEAALIAANLSELCSPRSVPVRRRTKVIESPEPAGGITHVGSNLATTPDGRLWRATQEEPSGFWQHLIGGDVMHPFFRLDNTVTGRSSSNLQNVPKRDPVMAKAFRQCFKARPGNVIIECDLSQAELRIMAWASKEQNMLRIYREGGDIHKFTAAAIAGVSHEEVTKALRQQAKAVNFGLIYLMWWKALMDYAKTNYQVNMTEKQAEAAYQRFFILYPGVAAYQKATVAFVKENGYVRALHGSLRRLPSINSDNEGIRKECERQSVNSPIQRFGSDIGLMGLARFARDCPKDKMWPVAFIHDAVVVECKAEYALEAASALRFYMQSIPFEDWFGITPPLPIVADVSIGETTLASVEERPDIEAKKPKWFRPELDATPVA